MLFGFIALVTTAILPAAWAGERECVACCRAVSMEGCRPALRLFGEGSRSANEAGAWVALGLWTLRCDGTGEWDPGAQALLNAQPRNGEVLAAESSPFAIQCFAEACALPQGACFYVSQGKAFVLTCDEGRPLSREAWAKGGVKRLGTEPLVAVVGERPLVVEPGSALTRASVRPGEPCTACEGNTHYASVAPRLAVVRTETSGATPAPPSPPPEEAGARPATTTAPRSPARSPSPGAVSPSDLDVPDPPRSANCGTAPTLVQESRRRVDLGDEAFVRQDLPQAIREYRAAVTIDRCNGFAWANLGHGYLVTGHLLQAIEALKVARDLAPTNYRVLTDLGEAFEATDDLGQAREAFQEALEVRPNHLPAEEGLARVRNKERLLDRDR